MRVIFFGTSAFAAHILSTIAADESLQLAAVITQPDKPTGRKQVIQESPVSAEASKYPIPILKPASLKTPEVIKQIQSLEPDLFIVVAYGQIIPQAVLDLAPHKAINIHGSLLPKYRGASPIHASLLNGDGKTGITLMLMDHLMDHGPIIAQKEISIDPDETFPVLEQRLCVLAQEMIIPTTTAYLEHDLQPLPQKHEEATYTKIITKEDGRIDWNRHAQDIYNQYRAYIQWPGIFTTWDNKKLKITECAYTGLHTDFPPGTVFNVNERVYVACGTDALELLSVQLEGKKETKIQDFLNGYRGLLTSKLV